MQEINKELLDMLTEFTLHEVGAGALDGITYALLLKDKDKETIGRYMDIKKCANNSGYASNEIFRVYEVSNGYIFDMDIDTVKQITVKIARSIEQLENKRFSTVNLIADLPEQRRKKDMMYLAKYILNQWEQGNKQLEVALFSRNSTNKIIINGRDQAGNVVGVKYSAYAIRHWDIEIINESLLVPKGIRVKRIKPCEVLPSKTGVSFIFDICEV